MNSPLKMKRVVNIWKTEYGKTLAYNLECGCVYVIDSFYNPKIDPTEGVPCLRRCHNSRPPKSAAECGESIRERRVNDSRGVCIGIDPTRESV